LESVYPSVLRSTSVAMWFVCFWLAGAVCGWLMPRLHTRRPAQLPIVAWSAPGKVSPVEFLDEDWAGERSFSSDVDCLLDSPAGSVVLSMQESSCFSHNEGEVRLSWSARGAFVTSTVGEQHTAALWRSATRKRARSIPLSEARAMLEQVVASIHTYEPIPLSTLHLFATITWTCDYSTPAQKWTPQFSMGEHASYGSPSRLFLVGARWFYTEHPQ
jgi:hypothetical protein